MTPTNEDVVEIYTLWNRLKKRFSLVRSQPKSFSLSNNVQLVSNVDFVLAVSSIEAGITTINIGGIALLLTVPSGKRWAVSTTRMERAGNYDFTEFLVSKGGISTSYDEFTATTLRCFYHPHPLLLSEGDSLGVHITNYVGSGGLNWRYWITETNMEE